MSEPTETKARLVENNNEFATDLYFRVADENAEKNLFFSPFSISSALAMTYAGAKGETEREMAEVLNFSPQEDLHQSFREVIEELNAGGKKGGYQLAVANRLFGIQGFEFVQDFLDLVAACYDGGLEPLDFIGDPEGSRVRINKWVEEKTNDKIKDLIPEGIIDDATRLVLVNAIYFKGDWDQQFDEEDTKTEDFTRSDGSAVEVPLMYQHTKFLYYAGEGFQALELPYINKALSMLVFLPNDVSGLNDLEQQLPDLLDLTRVGNFNSQSRKVETYLPRFKTTFATSLTSTLRSMGMNVPFLQGADFSGMMGKDADEDFVISDILHKAFIEVNEEGTEAAAATAVMVSACCAMVAPDPDPVFRVDHPFLFIIRDNNTGSILFMGRIEDPTDEG